ncbi:MAG: hypothetical protein ACRDCE_01600 [Cetobacterium sp.]|uniref:hypothetical protein n=1 Tax=Cetobacterium sp. TaxID=2071632 RepID=UPI003EE73517
MTRYHKMYFPIETKEAKAFWASRHKCNRLKAIVAFSRDYEDAMNNLRRFGVPVHLRLRAFNAFKNFLARPEMDGIPFSEMETPWYECIPHTTLPPAKGHWATWVDESNWLDTENWDEFIPDHTKTIPDVPSELEQ